MRRSSIKGELAVVNGGVRVASQNDGHAWSSPNEISAPARRR